MKKYILTAAIAGLMAIGLLVSVNNNVNANNDVVCVTTTEDKIALAIAQKDVECRNVIIDYGKCREIYGYELISSSIVRKGNIVTYNAVNGYTHKVASFRCRLRSNDLHKNLR